LLTFVGLSQGDDASHAVTYRVHHDYSPAAYRAERDVTGLAVVGARIFDGETGTVENFFGIRKLETTLSERLGGLVLVPLRAASRLQNVYTPCF